MSCLSGEVSLDDHREKLDVAGAYPASRSRITFVPTAQPNNTEPRRHGYTVHQQVPSANAQFGARDRSLSPDSNLNPG